MLLEKIGLNNASSPFGITYEVPIQHIITQPFFVIRAGFFVALGRELIYIVIRFGKLKYLSYIVYTKGERNETLVL